MDYEKKYKKALEKAKELFSSTRSVLVKKQTLESIFPELKESEDEQHRKWILEYLYDGLRKSDEQFKDQFKCAIAWLEKQGEQNPTDKIVPKFKVGDIIHRIGENTVYPIKIDRITDNNESYVGNNEKVFITIKFQDEYELVEQNPAEWSEEDERIRAKLLSYFNGFEESTSFGSREVIEIRHWLKSIRTVKQDWSEEDEKNPDREIPDCATCHNRGNTHQYVKGYEDGKKEAEQRGYERGYAKGYEDGRYAAMWEHLAPPPTIPPYYPAPYPGYPVYQPHYDYDQWRVTCTSDMKSDDGPQTKTQDVTCEGTTRY